MIRFEKFQKKKKNLQIVEVEVEVTYRSACVNLSSISHSQKRLSCGKTQNNFAGVRELHQSEVDVPHVQTK